MGLAAGMSPGSAGERGSCALLATAALWDMSISLWAFHCSAGARDAGFKEHLLKGAKPESLSYPDLCDQAGTRA